jgi:DNA-binding SARP family transcriptional activator
MPPGDDRIISELSRALDHYRGPFAPTLDADWADELRVRLEAQFLEAASQLATALIKRGRYAEAAPVYERILATDPLNEPACSGAMECQIALRNPGAAGNTYRRFRAALEAELGQPPGGPVQDLYRRALALTSSGTP